jgi:hypothetical protein
MTPGLLSQAWKPDRGTPNASHIVQQSLQVRTVSRPARVSAIVVPRTDQGPAGMGLTLDIGGGSIMLGIQMIFVATVLLTASAGTWLAVG